MLTIVNKIKAINSLQLKTYTNRCVLVLYTVLLVLLLTFYILTLVTYRPLWKELEDGDLTEFTHTELVKLTGEQIKHGLFTNWGKLIPEDGNYTQYGFKEGITKAFNLDTIFSCNEPSISGFFYFSWRCINIFISALSRNCTKHNTYECFLDISEIFFSKYILYDSFTDLLPLFTFLFFFIILVYRLFRVLSKIYTNNGSNEVLSPWRKKLKHLTEIKEDLTSFKYLFLAMLNLIVIIRSKLDPVFIWVLSNL